MMGALNRLRGAIVPAWVKWLAIAVLCGATYAIGRLQEARHGAEVMTGYITAQATRTVRIAQAQSKVVVQTEIKYRDRIKTVYLKGETIEKQVPILVTPSDDDAFGVNAGFVRAYNAAWSGDDPGPAAESDREPAGIPLSEIAEADVYNATACRAWREQALGWRDYYQRLKVVTNALR
ncbi:hypothetical protein GM658_12635 [Pseudoduganella eburnea]|uniref:Uncharacterized protein n=1 Tax=Massilia eburnea TaxID=1776165 RepID=A0A6L6QH94_9BURK|nr:hypothetical protein [Massilia eburnea]MTW11444.1 hypothetical protein [Massilia eburnea]